MNKRRTFGICAIVCILVIVAAIVIPMGTKLCAVLLTVGFFGTLFFGCQFAIASPVVADVQGNTRRPHKIVKKKIEINNVWDDITAQKKD